MWVLNLAAHWHLKSVGFFFSPSGRKQFSSKDESKNHRKCMLRKDRSRRNETLLEWDIKQNIMDKHGFKAIRISCNGSLGEREQTERERARELWERAREQTERERGQESLERERKSNTGKGQRRAGRGLMVLDMIVITRQGAQKPGKRHIDHVGFWLRGLLEAVVMFLMVMEMFQARAL